MHSLYRNTGRHFRPGFTHNPITEPFVIYRIRAIVLTIAFVQYTKDEEFAKRLHSRLRDEHVRVWFAPEDLKGGGKLYEQIERAIQIPDRLLIVLSDQSLKSEWVMTEIRGARKRERAEKKAEALPDPAC